MQDAAHNSVWPLPADPAAAGRLVERFAADPGGAAPYAVPGAVLAALGGNAPYLADLALREADTLRATLAVGPDAVVAREMAALRAVPAEAPRARVASALRLAKRRIALATALADIGGVWRLGPVTAALSDLADAALTLAVRHLLRVAHDAGQITLPDPAAPDRGSGFVVLGMGKLGAHELNYSSDIDLVLLYDPQAGIHRGDAPGAFFTRLARALVGLMDARDADGYVFRTDLRLRPDPAATPPCIALPAAITYYESLGQNWERAAMLKARPVAGDLATGEAFLAAIRPFVWRRHVDFAAVADIHGMKRRIDLHKGTVAGRAGDPAARLAGFDVKLGQGGIREIEFLAQTLQLVWGGRDPGLRGRGTVESLRRLARAGHLRSRAAGELIGAYRFLRRVEHRLQMVNDRQTHALPDSAAGLAAFAMFMGAPTPGAFTATLLRHLGRVRRRYGEVFEQVPDPPDGPASGLDFSGTGEAPPDTLRALGALGYAQPEKVFSAVQGWRSGRLRALRSERARELMGQLLPALLAAFARQGQPDAAFARFDAFLAALPAGVQLLSLFQRNPWLLARVATVLGAAPSLADHLTRTPSALEGLLTPDDAEDAPAALDARLADAAGLEEAIGVIRRAVREADFSICVATLEGRIDADTAGPRRADLADAAARALLPRVLADFASRFGEVPGGGLAVVLLGKAGGREMMAGSDLDLMLIYDHPPEIAESVGGRVLATSTWFIRAAHAFIAALTAPDAAGPLYAVDMRLRPSGNKGPVAVSLAAFERYHAPPDAGGDAWTWERMALTRARVVAGPAALTARVQDAIRAAMAGAGAADKIRADAASMRSRLARELPPRTVWDVKHQPGGQMEVEFIAQALQLTVAAAHPAATSPATRVALANLAGVGALTEREAEILIRADRLWRTTQGMLRLTEGPAPREALSDSTAEALLRTVRALGINAVDVDGLRATFADTAREVRMIFNAVVGAVES